MAFENLQALEAVDIALEDSEQLLSLEGVAVGVNAEVAPNVDGAGGTLTVTGQTEATATAPATVTVAYTLPDGTSTEATFELPEGYSVTGTTGTVYGEMLDRFVLPAALAGETDAGGPTSTLSTVTIGVGARDELSLLSAQPWPLSRELQLNDVIESIEFYPLGDGRLGYSKDGTRDDWGDTAGIAEQDGDGLSATRLGLDTFFRGHVIALDDGGFLFLGQGAGQTGFVLSQYDEMGALVEQQSVTGSSLATAEVPLTDDAWFFVLLDENEDLEIFIEDGAGNLFRTVLDILPVTEVVIEPTPEADDLILTEGDDVIDALGGDDTVKGLDGQDWIIGGAGDDSIDGGAGDDALRMGGEGAVGGLYGGTGSDSINGRAGADYLDGGEGADDLRGGAGDDGQSAALEGGEAGLYGGAGDDFIRGNRGDDLLDGGAGRDDMNGGFGSDVMYGGAGDDRMAGFDGNDVLEGGDGNDQMHGGRGDDILFGGAGDDVLRGAEGSDQLWSSGGGNDLLIGGAGADFFGTEGDAGVANIKDFEVGVDKIAVDAELTFEDIFLSQEESTAILQIGEATLRLRDVDIEDLSEEDFAF